MEIRIKGEALDLPSGFSVEIEETNPLYNDRGSQSIPATVPYTGRNNRLLDFPGRLDTDIAPNNPERTVLVCDGAYIRRGKLNVTDAGRTDGIVFNVGFDNSFAYSEWQAKKLSELSTLPVYRPNTDYPTGTLLSELFGLYSGPQKKTDPLAVFPVALSREIHTENDVETVYWEMLNVPCSPTEGFKPLTSVKRLADGTPTDISVPQGYAVSPFVKVWRVIELIFSDLNVQIKNNPFFDDDELARLVVLNNAADAVVTGSLRYADLMPDCTVNEFLYALYVRFGLVYNVNFDTMTAELSLVRDIIKRPSALELIEFTTEPEFVTYEAPQYLVLSSATSIEGAAPATERFEDFIKGLDTSHIAMGSYVENWQYPENGNDESRWDGDDANDWGDPDDPDYPDPDDPGVPDPDEPEPPEEPDYPDFGASRSRSLESHAARTSTSNTILAREFITGNWYWLDSLNSKVKKTSSGFFKWDPATKNASALELTGIDECVPIGEVNTTSTGTDWGIRTFCPLFLVGSRHYHSYIKGADSNEETETSTPLAFMFAYHRKGYNATVGRLCGESTDGTAVELDDGSKPKLSLYYQYRDGLFASFWSDYDELLRHANRVVTVSARMSRDELRRLNPIQPLTLRGVKCLIDSFTYTLPAKHKVEIEFKLRTIQPHGKYNIASEQNVPQFAVFTKHLEWRLKSETYGPELDTPDVRADVAQMFKDGMDYQPHGPEGDRYDVTAGSVRFTGITRQGLTWQTDTLTKPYIHGQRWQRQYVARLTYDIYELHDMTVQGGENDWELSESPLYTGATIDVPYTVVLVARWVPDE